VIHVYALTEADGPPLALRGIEDQPVRLIAGGSAAAVVSEHEAAPKPEAEILLRHARVVEQVMTMRPVLPARFGTGAFDEPEVRDRLAAPALPDALDRVRGRLELAVRVVSTADVPHADEPQPVPQPSRPPDQQPSRTGREHLARLAARGASADRRHQQDDERMTSALTRLERLADDVVPRPLGSPRVLWHAALLVPAVDREAFETAVGEVAADLAPDLAVLCTGPWPPYSFTPDQTGGGRAAVERSGA